MGDKLVRKGLVVGIIILFIGSNFVSGFNIQLKNTYIPLITSRGYIQGLIDNATDGDTIYIPSGTYYENIIINKSINLIGEDKDTTIIDGSDAGDVVSISADWVNISGFIIQDGYDFGIKIFSNHTIITGNNINWNNFGISLSSSNSNIITGNNISNNNRCGIDLKSSNNNIIGNSITNNSDGIYFSSSSGNNIIGNNIINNDRGIFLSSSNGNNILGNNISNNEYGIYSYRSSSNNIIDNTIISNNNIGVWLWDYCSGNNIIGNNISDNRYGVFLSSSSGNNIITDNNISNNSWGMRLGSYNNTINSNWFFNDGILVQGSNHNNVENNTVNGKPLIYLEDESNKVIDYEVGQTILVNCDNITIESLNLSNGTVGIELWRTHNSTIQNNDCSDNYYGIYSYGSSRNNIIGNNIISNIDDGIYLRDSNNIITGNKIISNNGNGISLYESSSNNSITSNIISNNRDGIYIYDSNSNIIIADNNISNNRYGIYLSSSSGNSFITGNNIISNNWDGIHLSDSSSNNNITGNKILNNNKYGIYLYNSSNNDISSNSFFGNGLFVEYTYDSNVENNTVNGKPLFYLEGESDKIITEAGQVILVNCDNITIENLNLSNTTVGIELWRTYKSAIKNNDCSDNYYGIYLYESERNNIIGNNITNNNVDGISLILWSKVNTITDNIISNNNRYGIDLRSSSNNIIGNNISNNIDGIFLSSSSNNIIGNNITNNEHGIRLSWSSEKNNIIYHNNFIENTYNAYDKGNNTWDDGKKGNYWSDYKEKYPFARKKPFKGIWDTPYEISGGNNKDNYPLIKQWSKSLSKSILENQQNSQNSQQKNHMTLECDMV